MLARIKELESIASTTISLTCNGLPLLHYTCEDAYLAAKYGGAVEGEPYSCLILDKQPHMMGLLQTVASGSVIDLTFTISREP